jgi:tryptophanase
LANIIEIKEIAKKYGIPVLFDSARFAENAYFIKTRESDYKDMTIKEIVKKMYSDVNYITMSSKKDAIVNIGGFIALRDEKIYKKVSAKNVIFEGYITYGGMSGRDMDALAVGLKENTEFEMLEARVKQIEYFSLLLNDYGIPHIKPPGGHAIYIKADEFLENVVKKQYPAQTLAVELYIECGVRGYEFGSLSNIENNLELLRLAIPRRTYTNNHINYVAQALKNVYDRRNIITKGLELDEEMPTQLPLFTVKLKRVE